MRGTRWLLLVAIAVILSGVGLTYRAQKKVLRDQAPPKPQPLPLELNLSAQHWTTQVTDHGRTVAAIDAEDIGQVRDSSRVDLRKVTLRLANKDGQTYNLVKSAAASFFTSDKRLYSEGEVEITLKLPLQGEPAHTPVTIKSSGVTFDTASGKADTDRPATFLFEHGDGASVGAFYDPTTHELLLKNNAELHWNPSGPNAKPMKIEAPQLSYHETTSEVWLKPSGRLTRENTVIEGNDVVVRLQDDRIRKVDAVAAHGTDVYPNRRLQYAADVLSVDFNDDGVVQKITGQNNARLTSTSASSETTMTANHVEMNFEPQGSQSELAQVSGSGHSLVTSKPLPAPGRPLSETHILSSETIDMKMRAGGHEIENVVTRSPGRLEFIPNQPVQHHRILDGKDMFIAYGPQNRIESFRATEARTATDPTAEEKKKRSRAPSTTASHNLLAHFDPKTDHMTSMEQWGDFTYDEGDRKARAVKATLDSAQNVILLEQSARIWDATGATSADHIRMDQRTGDFTAQGNVKSSRLPEKDQKKNSQMLSGDEPLEAQAHKMDSANRNRKIHYEGDVLMWQGANRIQADTIDLDREKHILVADGHAITSLWEEPKDTDKKKSAAPVLTVVRAPRLVYRDENRLALYTGGVTLVRPGLQMKSRELRAFLSESDSDSRLEKAISDGTVEIVQVAKDRTRTSTGEHSEYYTDDQKVIMKGGKPKLVDTKDGTTEGTELTYFANDDRLLVNGAPKEPGKSRIIRKHK